MGRTGRLTVLALSMVMIAGMICMFPGVLAAQPSPDLVGQVSILEGSATIVRNGQEIPASKGMDVFKSDTVRTSSNGQLRVTFSDQSVVSVGTDSSLTVNDHVYQPTEGVRKSTLDLLWGKIKCYIKDVSGYKTRRFDVNTPTAAIGVRGTTYIVDVQKGDGQTLAANLEGAVFASALGAPGQEVDLPSETYTEVRPGMEPSSPLTITPAMMITLHQGLLSMELGLIASSLSSVAAGPSTVPAVVAAGVVAGTRVAGVASGANEAGQSERSGDLFDLTIRSGNESYSKSFSNAEQIFREFRGKRIQSYLPGFETDASPFDGILNFRGLPMFVNSGSNSTAITLNIPAIGVFETFQGNTRDQSIDQLEDWLKGNSAGVLTEITQYTVKNTATDPVAGNPSSMMGRTVESSFNQGFMNITSELRANFMPMSLQSYAGRPSSDAEAYSGCASSSDQAPVVEVSGVSACPAYSGAPASEYQSNAPGSAWTPNKTWNNQMAFDATYAWVHTDSVDGYYYTLPLSYSFRWWEDPRKKLTISVPTGVSSYGNARAYNISAGLSLTWPLTDNWVITPETQYGFMGSLEAGSMSQMYSASLTSAYTWLLPRDMKLSMGNMVGYYKTLPAEWRGYNFDPDISAWSLRNGLMMTIPTEGLLAGSVIEPYFIDTRYLGFDMYIQSYEEVGLDFGISRFFQRERFGRKLWIERNYRLGVSYLFGDHDLSAVKAHFSFSF